MTKPGPLDKIVSYGPHLKWFLVLGVLLKIIFEGNVLTKMFPHTFIVTIVMDGIIGIAALTHAEHVEMTVLSHSFQSNVTEHTPKLCSKKCPWPIWLYV